MMGLYRPGSIFDDGGPVRVTDGGNSAAEVSSWTVAVDSAGIFEMGDRGESEVYSSPFSQSVK
jgi:hypothetical protein